MKKRFVQILIATAALLQVGCRKDDKIIAPTITHTIAQPVITISGLYLLNEGNMNTNMASLDYYDYTSGNYNQNIYGAANPGATKGLGDVGNDIGIYGSKMYIVVNASNKLEIVDALTVKRIKTIDIKNCRNVTFANGHAYVSAYDGDIVIGPGSPNGFIAEIDTAALTITRTVQVGRQPEQMAIVGSKLYIANSGGYSPPDYERTVSVIDLTSFKRIKDIDVAINLDKLVADTYGHLYVTSRGDYYTIPSRLFVIDTKTESVVKTFEMAAANIAICGDTAYVIGSEFNYNSGETTISYSFINTKTQTVLPGNFIKDGTEKDIKTPYGIAVDPDSRNIYLTDARDYVSSGTLYMFNARGEKIFSQTTGNIPAHFAFLPAAH